MRRAMILVSAIAMSLVVFAGSAGASPASLHRSLSSTSMLQAKGAGPSGQKKLSLSTVNFLSPWNGNTDLVWIAQQHGFFKREGVQVKLQVQSPGSATAAISSFLSGTYQFDNVSVAPTLAAEQAGADIKAVLAVETGATLMIQVRADVAKANHISAKASALKNFMALKGSHISLALVGSTSSSYINLIGICHAHHLTCAVDSPSSDINVRIIGTSPTMVAGFAAQKYDADMGSPAIVGRETKAVSIHVADIPPVSQASDYEVLTTASFIKAHPDTVQAVVNGLVRAWKFAKASPQKAFQDRVALDTTQGVSSMALARLIFEGNSRSWRTPLLLKSAFAKEEAIVNVSRALNKALSVPYSRYNDPAFVNRAVKALGAKAPIAA